MAITSIKIQGPRAASLGLPEQTLSRLGPYVVFAGKNGSGKSRMLRYIGDTINVVVSASANHPQENLASWLSSHTHEQLQQSGMLPQVNAWQQMVVEMQSLVLSGASGKVVRFLPGAGPFNNPDEMAPNQRRAYAESLVSGDGSQWPSGVLPYISELQDEWREATHQDSLHLGEDAQRAIERYTTLDDAISDFFGEGLGRDVRGGPTLYGKRVALADLSSGQQIALQLIAALHAQASVLGPSILLMDEPETHLHPAALVHLLSRIRRHAPDVQIWIATHSVPLLAYINSVQPSAIWGMSRGTAEFAGKRAADVLKDLLGDDESIGHLTSFMSLPHILASNNYAFQCLLPPEVVSTGAEDPQLSQIQTTLDAFRNGEALKIVDFGAGKGRLVEALCSYGQQDASYDYTAFDPSNADESQCRSAISLCFGSSEGRYFNDVERLISAKGEGWADCVIMTNVLHEIPVGDWLRLFSTSGLLSRVLRPQGFLLIVEDQEIPVGEMAHQHGFLLMNKDELVKFFDVTPSDQAARLFQASEARGGRLTAHLVSRQLFSKVSNETRRAALSAIKNLAVSKVGELRQAPKTYSNGLLHGLWTQQLANSTLALETF